MAGIAGSDRDGGYGWISIALHWLTAAAILVLLFAGDSIGVAGHEARRVHTTVALCAWLVLAVRVVWRLQQGHPPRAEGQGRIAFVTGMIVHYVLLAAIVAMLLSGPLAGWASGLGVELFDLVLPGAATLQPLIYDLARSMHIAGASCLAIGTSLHVAGVLKHMFFDRDHTLDRIMVPPARRPT
jgi:cytochrome b561